MKKTKKKKKKKRNWCVRPGVSCPVPVFSRHDRRANSTLLVPVTVSLILHWPTKDFTHMLRGRNSKQSDCDVPQPFNWRSEKFNFRESAFVFVEAVFCCCFLTFFIDLFKSVCIEDRNSGKKLRAPRKYDQMIEDSGKGFFFLILVTPN